MSENNVNYNILLIGTYKDGMPAVMGVISADRRENSLRFILLDKDAAAEGGCLADITAALLDDRAYRELMEVYSGLCGIRIKRYTVFNLENALYQIDGVSIKLSPEEIGKIEEKREPEYEGKKIILSPEETMEFMMRALEQKNAGTVFRIIRAAAKKAGTFSVKGLRELYKKLLSNAPNNVSMFEIFSLLMKFKDRKDIKITKLMI